MVWCKRGCLGDEWVSMVWMGGGETGEAEGRRRSGRDDDQPYGL